MVATYDGSSLQLWVNGFVNVTVPASGSLFSSGGALRIGGDSVWGEYFNGIIDEVRIYNRALSQAEIQSDMNTPVGNTTPPPSPPQNTAAPTISGTPQQGQVLTANEGSWTDTPTFAYQWRRCDSAGANCADIAGAAAKTYTVAAADVGGTLRVVVKGTNAAGSNSATSAATAVVTAAPAPTSDVTVTVDRSQPDIVSRLALGVTHTQYSVDSWGDATAVANAKNLLAAAAPYQNQNIYGWGTINPEPSPGVFDWSTLDARMAIIRSMSATPVITLCCAPDWMTSLGSNTSTYPNIPPTPAHYADFANLAKQIALRYPDVKYYMVWNEFKGWWSNSLNNWDYAAYTNLYNAVYDALKSVDPTIQVGGPYLVVNGTGSGSLGKSGGGTYDPVSTSDMQVIDYWLANKHGADFLAIDRSVLQPSQDSNAYSESQLLSLAHWFGDVVTQIRSHTGTTLPIWYAEDYFNPDLANITSSDAFQAVALSSLLYNEL
ncbi:MAG TPA: LamG-like jellyroll fold domain-containing protein, partial [Mycobacteriales bacterium]|nr:LamG-like jellyroll fold domain-containing protein [Mycobacteriales bacterium]